MFNYVFVQYPQWPEDLRLELEVVNHLWVLGTKPRFPARAASALTT